jgi:hypothetical protein
MSEKKPARNVSGLNPDVAKTLNCLTEEDSLKVNQGTFGTKLLEPVPHFIKTESEKEICNENNASIVLGRDRPSNVMSGYGGRGDTQAGSIHMVVGRMAHKPKSDVHVDPSFQSDAACIYISQKTDIDANFRIAPGNVGSPEFFERPASGVALKGDGVRLCARDGGIKLVTGIDAINSQGGKIKSRSGIDLIAGNDDRNMQPIPKGHNLSKALAAMADEIANLSGIISGLTVSLEILNLAVASHTHINVPPIPSIPPIPGFSLPSMELSAVGATIGVNLSSMTQPSLAFIELNQPGYKFNFLNPYGKYYINSEHNFTN